MSLLEIQSISEVLNSIPPPSPPSTLAGTGQCCPRPPVIWVSKSVVQMFGKTLWLHCKALYLHATARGQTKRAYVHAQRRIHTVIAFLELQVTDKTLSSKDEWV